VVAARLSEDPQVRVALVEAGPRDNNRVFELPALFLRQLKSQFDWDFQTEPEPGLNRRRAYLPRGRVLGGTSSMNTMVYTRGNRIDYDEWAQMGCAGWGYDDVLPYFIRSEDNERGAGPFHGVGGPLRVSDARSVHPLLEAWVEAASAAGQPLNDDFNGATQEGFGIYQFTQRDGLRCSVSRAFIAPVQGRPNLTILPSTLARRILFQGTRAVGLEVQADDATRVLDVEREVIVSAGAYMSPQLLMLSGVGPGQHLAEHGIDVLVDLPVGENLQDHPGCFLSYYSRLDARGDADSAENERLLRTKGEGPLTWTEAGGFARTREGMTAPDVQFHAALGLFADEGLAESSSPAFAFGPYVARPASRGRVWLRSALPEAKPRILHNFLTEPEDVETLREGLLLALEIGRQAPLARAFHPEVQAREDGLLPASESARDLDAYMRANLFSFYHPSGTCAIGQVVDTELRVLGVDGVRVADTSIMPTLLRGNTNAPAIMVGEKVVDYIRASTSESTPNDQTNRVLGIGQ
jgi:choline dehydrogenase